MYQLQTSTLADRLAVTVGRVLYRWIFPAVRFHGAARFGRIQWVSKRRMVARYGDCRLELPALDSYWSRFVYRDQEYEPEIAWSLRFLGSAGPALFLDCGANFGYWSARVASREFGDHRVVAVEASRATFEILAKNVSSALHAAISNEVGEVRFDDTLPHQARQISGVRQATSVRATTIDELAQGEPRVLIKLDVEGGESAAVAGAIETLRSADVAFLYEDHGSDPECNATASMHRVGLSTYFISKEGKIQGPLSVDDVRGLKEHQELGYNFVGVQKGRTHELQLLEALRQTSRA